MAAAPPDVKALPDSRAQASFVPSDAFGFDDLVKAVSRSPEVAAADREVRIREAAVDQSRLWPNPVLDATWGTIPIGRTNPPGIRHPLQSVPNYRVGVSYTIPLGKRGPLQAARQSELISIRAERCAVGRERALELAASLGEMAITELRIAALGRLLDAAHEQERQVEMRLKMQLASGLELDRVAIERGRLEQQLHRAESDLSAEQAACSATTGQYCERFESDRSAQNYLEKWVNLDETQLLQRAGGFERPDAKALANAAQAAKHQRTYYARQKIPDVTLRVGFTHDQFEISGNQPSSIDLTAQLPLPMFDWGQAGVRSATAAADGYSAERRALLKSTQAIIPALVERLRAQRSRRKNLLEVLIPRAQAVVADVVRAYDTRLLSMNDVIQARRALLDLVLDEVDGLADAYAAALGLRAQVALTDNEGCNE